jgi:cytochrome c553
MIRILQMRYRILLSLTAVMLLITACSEETQKSAAEATAKTAEAAKAATTDVKKAASELAEATKAKAKALAEEAEKKSKVLATSAEEKAEEVKEKLEKKAEETTEAVKKAVTEEEKDEGEVLYAKCAGCHGKDGKTKALGKSELLAGQSKEVLEEKLTAYQAGKRNVAGMGTLMKGQVAGMSEENIEDLAEYISEFK